MITLADDGSEFDAPEYSAAFALAAGWAALLWPDVFALYPAACAVGGAVLYALTLLALARATAGGRRLPVLVPVLALPVTIVGVYTGWGLLLGALDPGPWLQGQPPGLRLGAVFLAGPLAACLLALALAYPLRVLYRGWHWLPVAVAAFLVLSWQWADLVSPDTRGLTRAVLVSEWLSLALLVPVAVGLAAPRPRRPPREL